MMPTVGLSNVGLADSYYRAPPGQGNGLIASVVPYDPGFTIHFSVRVCIDCNCLLMLASVVTLYLLGARLSAYGKPVLRRLRGHRRMMGHFCMRQVRLVPKKTSLKDVAAQKFCGCVDTHDRYYMYKIRSPHLCLVRVASCFRLSTCPLVFVCAPQVLTSPPARPAAPPMARESQPAVDLHADGKHAHRAAPCWSSGRKEEAGRRNRSRRERGPAGRPARVPLSCPRSDARHRCTGGVSRESAGPACGRTESRIAPHLDGLRWVEKRRRAVGVGGGVGVGAGVAVSEGRRGRPRGWLLLARSRNLLVGLRVTVEMEHAREWLEMYFQSRNVNDHAQEQWLLVGLGVVVRVRGRLGPLFERPLLYLWLLLARPRNLLVGLRVTIEKKHARVSGRRRISRNVNE